MKYIHKVPIILSIISLIGLIVIQFLVMVDFNELEYVKGQVIDIAPKRIVSLNSSESDTVVLHIACFNEEQYSDDIVALLKQGDKIEAWYAIRFGPFEPEVFQFKNNGKLICDYEYNINRIKLIRNILLIIGFLSLSFAYFQFLSRRKEGLKI